MKFSCILASLLALSAPAFGEEIRPEARQAPVLPAPAPTPVPAFRTVPPFSPYFCNTVERMHATLQREKYGETLVARGIEAGSGYMVEIWMNPDNGGWSVVRRLGNSACFATSGGNLEFVTPEEPEAPAAPGKISGESL